MRKTVLGIPLLVVILAVLAASPVVTSSAHAKPVYNLNPVENPLGDCSSATSADECMSMEASQNQTCQSNSCAVCVFRPVSSGSRPNPACVLDSQPGACKCTVAAGASDCTTSGTCYYHP